MATYKKSTRLRRARRGRVPKDEYYLNIAREVARRSTCLRRNFGAVLVNNDQIVSTGYGGAARKTINCTQVGTCVRTELKAAKGEHYEWCRAVHAEQNAIIQAPRFAMIGATLYLVGVDAQSGEILPDAEPCRICKRIIINAGIKQVTIRTPGASMRRQRIADWIRANLGDYRKSKGKLVPVLPQGY